MEMAELPPVECELKVGDEVSFKNDYGVEFFGFNVIGFSESAENGRFIHINSDSYWFPVKPASLTKQIAAEQMDLLNINKRYFDMPELLKRMDGKGLVAIVNGYNIKWNSHLQHFSLSHDDIGVIDHHHSFETLCDDALKG